MAFDVKDGLGQSCPRAYAPTFQLWPAWSSVVQLSPEYVRIIFTFPQHLMSWAPFDDARQ